MYLGNFQCYLGGLLPTHIQKLSAKVEHCSLSYTLSYIFISLGRAMWGDLAKNDINAHLGTALNVSREFPQKYGWIIAFAFPNVLEIIS